MGTLEEAEVAAQADILAEAAEWGVGAMAVLAVTSVAVAAGISATVAVAPSVAVPARGTSVVDMAVSERVALHRQ
ncbi:MAG TPA: hypothetical protein VNY82_03775 [Steroidobacteraceae bacterium]|nr:hypothetical protein [Steroidobacteraceae bacterium]